MKRNKYSLFSEKCAEKEKQAGIFCTARYESIMQAINYLIHEYNEITLIATESLKNDINIDRKNTKIRTIRINDDHFDYNDAHKYGRLFKIPCDDLYIIGGGKSVWSDYVECICIAEKMIHNNLYLIKENRRVLISQNNSIYKFWDSIKNKIILFGYYFYSISCSFVSYIKGYKW